MEQLGERNYSIILRGVKTWGSFDPEVIFYVFEEELQLNEAREIRTFLEWCHANDKKFGSSNYEVRFAEFKSATSTGQLKRRLTVRVAFSFDFTETLAEHEAECGRVIDLQEWAENQLEDFNFNENVNDHLTYELTGGAPKKSTMEEIIARWPELITGEPIDYRDLAYWISDKARAYEANKPLPPTGA